MDINWVGAYVWVKVVTVIFQDQCYSPCELTNLKESVRP